MAKRAIAQTRKQASTPTILLVLSLILLMVSLFMILTLYFQLQQQSLEYKILLMRNSVPNVQIVK